MIMECCQVIISATSRKEAIIISDSLLKKKLIAGSLILKGPSRYWWRGKIVERQYFNVEAFSVFGNKRTIIKEVERIHSDKCPIIAFLKLEGNSKFINWIKETVQN